MCFDWKKLSIFFLITEYSGVSVTVSGAESSKIKRRAKLVFRLVIRIFYCPQNVIILKLVFQVKQNKRLCNIHCVLCMFSAQHSALFYVEVRRALFLHNNPEGSDDTPKPAGDCGG